MKCSVVRLIELNPQNQNAFIAAIVHAAQQCPHHCVEEEPCKKLHTEGNITVCSEPGGKGDECKTCEDYVIAYTPGCVPDGTYNGTQSGYDLTFIYKNNTYVAKTKRGIRGINMPVTFHVVNGNIVYGNMPVDGERGG